MNNFNWDKSFLVDFDLKTGFSKSATTTKRYLSDMKSMFVDQDAAEELLAKENPLIYEFHELGCPERAGDLAFGTTILYPGQVGSEYFMTKGHFHTVLDTAEVYYTLSGEGYMVMENQDGETLEEHLSPTQAVYVPRGYAHRTVNTGTEPLVLFFTFSADAGHNYGTIETKGYHKMVISDDGNAKITDNPNW